MKVSVRHVSVVVKFKLSPQGTNVLCSIQQPDRLSSCDRAGLKENFSLANTTGYKSQLGCSCSYPQMLTHMHPIYPHHKVSI